MAEKKVEINIVYAPGDAQKIMYENDRGTVWQGNTYDHAKHNIGMGWYSIQEPKPQDSILVVEPFCVLQRDYDPRFLKQFRYVFTWATEAMYQQNVKSNIIKINHPTYHDIPNLRDESQKWPSWDSRKNEIVIIANNKSSEHHSELYSLRIFLADVLDAYSSYDVSWYGQMPIKRKYYKGKLQDKNQALESVKFSICTENSYDSKFTHNYFTEKMPDVWAHGAVPIYMGCHNIDDFGSFNDCYIDLRQFVEKNGKSWRVNKAALNDTIVNFDNNQYNQYVANLHSHVEDAKVLETHHSFKNVYDKLIDTFYQENNE